MDQQGTPAYHKLMDIVEPYSYRERLTMPKFLINAAGDQFFLPDSSRFYFDSLRGEKYLRYVPNADHSLKNSDALQSSLAFYQAFVTNTPRPQFSWTFEKDGAIRVVSKDKPSAVKLWHATNPEARDFRLMTIGPAYKSEDLQESGKGIYVGEHAQARERLHRLLRRTHLPQRRQVPLQVHHRRARQSRRRTFPGIQAQAVSTIANRPLPTVAALIEGELGFPGPTGMSTGPTAYPPSS